MLAVTVSESGTVYAYARVSTYMQSLDRQINNIRNAYPLIKDCNIYCEKYTGTTANRPNWNKLFSRVKKGDAVIFDSVSRMSRNAEEGTGQYFELYERGVNLYFLNEPHINTDVYRQEVSKDISSVGDEIADIYIRATNEAFKIIAKRQIEIAFEQSQKEVDDLHKRVTDGMAAKKKKALEEGIIKENESIFGHKKDALVTTKSVYKKVEILQLCKDFKGTFPDKKCIEYLHISRNTYFKYKKEMLEELKEKTLDDFEKNLNDAVKSREEVLEERRTKRNKKS